MDSLTHNGKEYKKVAVLAREFNYTTDYIGQLCRADKLDARVVGRAWYVNPESLKNHKKSRYQETFKKKIEVETDQNGQKNFLSRVDVESVRTNKTTKIHRDLAGKYKEISVSYESDSGSLIPKVKKIDSKPLQVDLAESRPITIVKKKQTQKPTVLKPTELPKVYLKGKLPVSAVLEKTSLPVNEDSSVARDVTHILQKPQVKTLSQDNPQKVTFAKKVNDNNVEKYSYLGKNSHKIGNDTPEVKIDFQPENVRKQAVSRNKKTHQMTKAAPALVLASIILAFCLLSLRSEVVINDSGTQQKIFWNFNFFSEILNSF